MRNPKSSIPAPRQGDYYHCAELARLLGRHPNTLRKYETWGFIAPVPRGGNGYRLYDRRHALQGKLAVTALGAGFADWRGRRLMLDLIRAAAQGNYEEAQDILDRHKSLLAEAEGKLHRAKEVLDRWQSGERGPDREIVGRWRAAAEIGVAPDTLRDWERSGLVKPGRLQNGRRFYDGAALDRLLVIKVLRSAGYSLMGVLSLFSGRNRDEDLSFARDKWDQTLRGLIADTKIIQAILRELTLPPFGL